MLGTGTSADPYQIVTREDLESITTLGYAKFYKLMNDIDLSGADWIPFPDFQPNASTTTTLFTGRLDGNGFSIKNMRVNSTRAYVGLFERTGHGSNILNLGLVDFEVNGGTYTGGLVGYCQSNIQNCYVKGKVTTDRTGTLRVGGVVGNLATTSSNHAHIRVDVEINLPNVTQAYCGLLCGSLDNTMQYSNIVCNGVRTFGSTLNVSNSIAHAVFGFKARNASFVNVYYDKDTTQSFGVASYIVEPTGVSPKTTAELKAGDITLQLARWTVEVGKYPYLTSFPVIEGLKQLIEVLSSTKQLVSKVSKANKKHNQVSSIIKNFDSSSNKSVKVVKINDNYIRTIETSVIRVVQVINIREETVTSYLQPIQSNAEAFKEIVRQVTMIVKGELNPLSSKAIRSVQALREALSFVDEIVGGVVVPTKTLEQLVAMAFHLENGTLSQYLQSEYNHLQYLEDNTTRQALTNQSQSLTMINQTQSEVRE